jgi:tetratricopeptide (TPR) repeat protein
LKKNMRPELWLEFVRILIRLEKFEDYDAMIHEVAEYLLSNQKLTNLERWLDIITFHIHFFSQEPIKGFLEKIIKRELYESNSRNIELYVRFGNLCRKAGMRDLANELVYRARAIDPLYMKLKTYDEVDWVLHQHQNSPSIYVYRDASQELQLFEGKINSIPFLFNAAQIYKKAGLKSLTIKNMYEAISLDPNCMEGYEELVRLEPQPEKRREILKNIKKMDSKGYTRLGDFFFYDLRKFDEAFEAYNMRVDVQRDHLRSRFMIWRCLNNLKRNDEADKYLNGLKAVYSKELERAPRIIEENRGYQYERQNYPDRQQMIDAYGE